jgi:1,4-dihydroxy-6-naphthoate synthase
MTLGFSPCPNDTFIFEAMLHGRIDTEGLHFEPVIEDVEALNQRASKGELAITKLSYHAFAHFADHYALLQSGSALGHNCGPLLIARTPRTREAIEQGRIAIPGRMTTANFLLSVAYPDAQNRQTYLFSDIEDAILKSEVDMGLIIHENRFTYQQKGLVALMDLGAHWESVTGLPIPLGGIAVRRDLDADVQARINRVLQRSVAYAWAHTDTVMPYVRKFAQSMDDAVMQAHIDLYVNQHTYDLGTDGRAAVTHMMDLAAKQRLLPAPVRPDIWAAY